MDVTSSHIIFKLISDVFTSNIETVFNFIREDPETDSVEALFNEAVLEAAVKEKSSSSDEPGATSNKEEGRNNEFDNGYLDFDEPFFKIYGGHSKKYSDEKFYNWFCMKKSTFFKLLKEISVCDCYKVSWLHGKEPISMDLKTEIGLVYLSSQLRLKQIAETFKVSLGAAYRCVHMFCDAVCTLTPKYIVWPKKEDCPGIAQKFQEIANLPGVIGAIDILEISARFPRDNKTEKNPYKNVVLQGVCNSEKVFTDIHLGTPGQRYDVNSILRASNIENPESSENLSCYSDYHIASSGAYTQKDWLLSPFYDYHMIPSENEEFNAAINKTRMCIDEAFELLQSRWKRLQFVDVNKIKGLTRIIIASCVLHNFCLLNDDFYDENARSEIPLRDVNQMDIGDNNKIELGNS